MNPGDLVRVYIDPASKKKLEGWAYIVEILKESYSYYCCNVRFEMEDRIVYRRILKHKY